MQSILIRELVPQESNEDKDALLPVFLEVWNNPENLKYLSPALLLFGPQLVQAWLLNHK